LRRLGVRAGTLVGVCVDRSEQLIVSLLGILKAGGAYVPLDAAYPAKRLEFMFADAALDVLVTQRAALDRLRGRPESVQCVELDDPTLDAEPAEAPQPGTTPDDLAYVIYTSGSTGVPKGVEVRHRGVLRLVFGSGYARFGAETRTLQIAPEISWPQS
jgi:non-ribosomal peptide synthetase component F